MLASALLLVARADKAVSGDVLDHRERRGVMAHSAGRVAGGAPEHVEAAGEEQSGLVSGVLDDPRHHPGDRVGASAVVCEPLAEGAGRR